MCIRVSFAAALAVSLVGSYQAAAQDWPTRPLTLVVPFSHDMFFPPEDCEAEQRLIPNSRFRVVQSLWAHFAMFCMTPSEREQIDACIADLLNEPA